MRKTAILRCTPIGYMVAATNIPRLHKRTATIKRPTSKDANMGRHVLLAAALSSAFYFQCADAHPSIPFEVKWQSTFGPAAPTYVAIKSNEQWLRFWESMRVDQERFVHSPPPSFDKAPEIDFSRYTLIVVGTGTKPSGGFGISIQNVVQKPLHSSVCSRKDTRPQLRRQRRINQSIRSGIDSGDRQRSDLRRYQRRNRLLG
jgi:hypothetical protein